MKSTAQAWAIARDIAAHQGTGSKDIPIRMRMRKRTKNRTLCLPLHLNTGV